MWSCRKNDEVQFMKVILVSKQHVANNKIWQRHKICFSFRPACENGKIILLTSFNEN